MCIFWHVPLTRNNQNSNLELSNLYCATEAASAASKSASIYVKLPTQLYPICVMTPMSDKFWHLAAPLHSGVWEIQQNLSGMGPLLLAKFWTNAELLSQSYLATSDCLKILVLFSSSTENLIPKLATWNSWKSPPPLISSSEYAPSIVKSISQGAIPAQTLKFSSWAH